MKYGCQTYTWQMSYEKYKGKLDAIMDVIANAGFQGIEAEICMLGAFYEDAALLKEALIKRDLKLAALTLALPWKHSKETDEERMEAERLIDYLRYFPESYLVLVPLPGNDRSNLAERQRHSLQCVNEVAKRAHARGITSVLHPNSPSGSVFRTEEDYQVMFAGIDTRYLGYAPDSGHIANGGMNPVKVFAEHVSIIKHVHFKDASSDHKWRAMGDGDIDHPYILRILKDNGYDGWIMVEEESEQGEQEPELATIHNGTYMKRQWRKLHQEMS